MKVVFNVQDVSEYMNESLQPLAENPTKVQRATFKEPKKKYQKVLFYIHKCVNTKVFGKIS